MPSIFCRKWGCLSLESLEEERGDTTLSLTTTCSSWRSSVAVWVCTATVLSLSEPWLVFNCDDNIEEECWSCGLAFLLFLCFQEGTVVVVVVGDDSTKAWLRIILMLGDDEKSASSATKTQPLLIFNDSSCLCTNAMSSLMTDREERWEVSESETEEEGRVCVLLASRKFFGKSSTSHPKGTEVGLLLL